MIQKVRIFIGASAFALLITGAVFAYNALKRSINPEIMLSEQPGSIPTSESHSETSAQESEKTKAPDFTVEDSVGNNVKLCEMKGKPLVINFWASWCPPCRAEMLEFDNVYMELGEDVTFMMINMADGLRETKEKGMEYVTEQGFSFPIYYDTKQEAAYAYGIRSLPTTIFIDSDGYIITGAEGQIDEKTLRYGISLIQTKEDETSEHEATLEYRKISAEEAYRIMNETDGFILLDVRTAEEYQENHIDGAVLIPDYEISERAESELPNKDSLILVYCHSGRRSTIVANALIGMGYTNVYDFGGIIDWPYDVK